jgi:hypothetical protein
MTPCRPCVANQLPIELRPALGLQLALERLPDIKDGVETTDAETEQLADHRNSSVRSKRKFLTARRHNSLAREGHFVTRDQRVAMDENSTFSETAAGRLAARPFAESLRKCELS